ncbi:MAG: 2-oxo acid dehydrogenase subunit E2 [Simkaniaceae bacterium]|nr:2-oxo acid dehydrogenase subunit E2 [Simkaniaceae bacterium]
MTITLPKLGESIVSATVIQWFKQEGDPISLDEPLLEVATDKVNSEIPSPVTGILKKILVLDEGDVEVGQPLAVIATSEKVIQEAVKREEQKANCSSGMKDFLSPAVLRLAREKGLDVAELEKMTGSGNGGRVTKKDLEEYLLKEVKQEPVSSCGVERVKMTHMRKAIADHLVRSFNETPSATLITEIDVTRVVQEIQKTKESFFAKHGYKISITSYLARAIASAVKEFPLVNSSLEKDTILLKKQVHLGIAVSIKEGLLVPVIKDCDTCSLEEIAKKVAVLSTKAREGTLSPEEVQGSTLTMTNFGMSGIMIGIPIIPYGETAILGVGAIQRKVVPLEGESFGIRQMMHLSLTFDHRVFDGMYGCGYLGAIKASLEKSSKSHDPAH